CDEKLTPSVLGLWGDSLDHLVHLLVAFVLALPIGWHRAREEQSAGLRTPWPRSRATASRLIFSASALLAQFLSPKGRITDGMIDGENHKTNSSDREDLP